ncbi:putative steroid dehydrogenase [Lindgomyces ingoldianus]|uniref:Steroid dehydrogenase n=1 Tax=Lindgomyces ingoldianus TaxID=673940 RepID=A0ACB6RC95_9PLEO|nr:putative steroid dehydrogenase [Lindgomyces ingoldianus]KAF2476091.1 putative steroid dehydrogenase [Lindgomyces ingoldianus]
MPLGGVGLSTIWTQFSPPKDSAPITEKNIASQMGKVFIVTGGSSGIGFELSRILYAAGAKVYILSRTKSNIETAVKRIEETCIGSSKDNPGSLHFIYMDLEDLESVQHAATIFREKETRLDVLYCNAGLAVVPGNPKTKQGLELHIGVNNIAHVLLERLLLPVLTTTAKMAPKDSVRVVWASTILLELGAPKGGIPISQLDSPGKNTNQNYAISKTAMWFAASELSKRHGRDTGVINIAGNPGTYLTNAWRTTPSYVYYPFRPLMRDPIFGAYTYLWMGLSDEVTMEDAVQGRYAICNGRWHPGQRGDLVLATRGMEEGGTGQAKEYMDWVERKIGAFLRV